MKRYETDKTSVTVTELRDYAIWGEWDGNQSEAEGIINELPGASGLAKLFDVRGHAAGGNAAEGTFCVDCKTAEWELAINCFALLPSGEVTGPEFAAARKAAGFSQQALAQALNVARATVSRWEGGSPPKTAVLALRSLMSIGENFPDVPAGLKAGQHISEILPALRSHLAWYIAE